MGDGHELAAMAGTVRANHRIHEGELMTIHASFEAFSKKRGIAVRC